MATSLHSTMTSSPKPIICEAEVEALSRRLGVPNRHSLHIQADTYLQTHRWRSDSDRRAEVVFAIQDPAGRVWVHAKAHYPRHIFRLPSGGIHWDEGVEEALWREVSEETALEAEVTHFLAVVDYEIHNGESTARFASYVFLLQAGTNVPRPHADEKISEFRRVLPCQLREMAAELRNLMGDRRGWGQFRAFPHDLVYEHLNG